MKDDSEGEEEEEEYSDDDYEEYEELVRPFLLRSLGRADHLVSQEIDEGDQAILDSYMPSGQLEGGRTLADLIMEKIDAQEGAADAPAREFARAQSSSSIAHLPH